MSLDKLAQGGPVKNKRHPESVVKKYMESG